MPLPVDRRRLVLAVFLAFAAFLGAAQGAQAADVNCSLFGGPCNIAFPDTNFGSTSTKSVEMTNDGPPNTTLTVGISGGTEFSLSGNTCGSSMASGATCTFDVVYGPTGGTNHDSSDTLTIQAGGFPPILVTGGLSGKATGGVPAAPTPTVTAVSPSSGTAGQTAVVTLTGTNFGATSGDLTDVSLLCGPGGGNHTGTDVTWISSTSLTVRVPALTAGVSCTFRVTAGGGNSAPPTPSTPTYTYIAPPPTPAVTGFSPTSGDAGASAVVTLTGTDFGSSSADLTGVTLHCAGGTVAGTDVTWISSTSLTVRVPARSAGDSCSFTVTANGQTSANSSAGYEYVEPAPVVTAVSPVSAPTSADVYTTVTLSGLHFDASNITDVVAFCGTGPGHSSSGTTWISATQVSLKFPVFPAGTTCTFQVVGTRTSAKSTATFTFTEAVPAITAVSPSTGRPLTPTLVTLTGTGFGSSRDAISAVKLDCGTGLFPANDVTWVSSTSITLTIPSLDAGLSCKFKVTANGETSTLSDATYTSVALPGPKVTDVSPTSGPAGETAVVKLNGSNWLSTPLVRLDCGADGTRDILSVERTGEATFMVRLPARPAGTVCAFVLSAVGQLTTTSTATYTYTAPPQGVPTPTSTGGHVITGTDGSSVSTNGITPPGGGTVSVQNGKVVLPGGGANGGTVTADVTKGTTSTAATSTPPQHADNALRIVLRFAVPLSSSPSIQASINNLVASLATSAGVSSRRFQVIQVDAENAERSSIWSTARRAAADPAPCTAATPAGARCRVTWKLPKVAPGAWSMDLKYGGLSIPVTYVAQPALKVTAPASRCMRRGAAGTVPRVKSGSGSTIAVVAVKLSGSKLGCRGKAGTTNHTPTGKPKLVSKTASKRASVQQGLRKLGKGDYLLVWLGSKAGTPSPLQTSYLKVR